MTATITESTVEDATLAWLEELGYSVLHGPDIAAGELAAERSDPETIVAMLNEFGSPQSVAASYSGERYGNYYASHRRCNGA